MKYLLIIFLFISCTKEADEETPTANITSTVKVYSGSNPSIKIDYTLTYVTNVQTTYIANQNYGFSGSPNFQVPTTSGSAVVYDHGNFGNSANYYFVFNMKDGTQKQSPVFRVSF